MYMYIRVQCISSCIWQHVSVPVNDTSQDVQTLVCHRCIGRKCLDEKPHQLSGACGHSASCIMFLCMPRGFSYRVFTIFNFMLHVLLFPCCLCIHCSKYWYTMGSDSQCVVHVMCSQVCSPHVSTRVCSATCGQAWGQDVLSSVSQHTAPCQSGPPLKGTCMNIFSSVTSPLRPSLV